MAEDSAMWIGKDEHEGVLAQPRKDLKPPRHWRLEAVAYTPMPRTMTIGADRRRAVFIEDADTSDVWLLDLGTEGPPERLTTGRDPVPFWADVSPRISPDSATVAYGDEEHVWLVPAAGGPARKLTEGSSPIWIDDEQLVISVEREDTTRLAVVSARDPWPRRLATAHDDLDEYGDEGEAVVSPDGSEVAYTFTPRADLNRSEIRVASLESGAVRALTGTPRMHDREPAWSPDGALIAYTSERSGFYEIHLVADDGTDDRQLTRARADHGELDWHPDGSRLLAVRGRSNHFDLVAVDVKTGDDEVLARGGTWCTPSWTAVGDIVAGYEGHATPRELRRVMDGKPKVVHAPAPLSVKRAPHAELEDVSFPSFDGLEIPGFLLRPRDASSEQPVPAVVYPHGGPTDAYGDEWDGHAQYFVDRGFAWLAINFRGSTGYGRDFERLNHGVWGVDDTKDCLAAADFLRTLDWVDGERLGIFGASYGSYMALLSVTDDPEYRYRCAVAKYGDCDITTLVGAGRPRGRPGPRAHDGPAVRRARGVHRRLGLPPARERPRAAPDRARRARRARQPEAVRAARRDGCASSARPSST